MSGVVATLMDLGWTPREPDKWKSPAGDWWEFSGGTFTSILDEIHVCTVNMGNGLEHGVDMCGFHKQHAWLVRKDLHGKAGLIKAAAAGGLWSAARLRAADERYDGLCPRCLAEGVEPEEDNVTLSMAMLLQPEGWIFQRNGEMAQDSGETERTNFCFWTRGLVPNRAVRLGSPISTSRTGLATAVSREDKLELTARVWY